MDRRGSEHPVCSDSTPFELKVGFQSIPEGGEKGGPDVVNAVEKVTGISDRVFFGLWEFRR